MKTLVSLFGGAVSVSEQGGDVYLNFDGEIGGGSVKGIVEGKGTIKLGSGSIGLKLAESFINAHLPATLKPMAEMAEAALNSAVAGV